jgi:hypothetical protein
VPKSPEAGGLLKVKVQAWSSVAEKKLATVKSSVLVPPVLPIAEPLIA